MKKILLLLFLFPSVLFAQLPNWSWAKKIGWINNDGSPYAIKTDDVGNSYVTGSFIDTLLTGSCTAYDTVPHAYVAKFDASGTCQWVVGAQGSGWSDGNGITIDFTGAIWLAGDFIDTCIIGNDTLISNGNYNFFVAKLDAAGNFLWAISDGGTKSDFATSVSADTAGNFYVSGAFDSISTIGTTNLTSYGSSDVFVCKYDQNGNSVWAVSAGSPDIESPYFSCTDKYGNTYLTGRFEDSITIGSTTLLNAGGPFSDIYSTKCDANGNFVWAKRIGGDNFPDYPGGISYDGLGNVYVSGQIGDSIVFASQWTMLYGLPDAFIAKYDANGNEVWFRNAGGYSEDYSKGIETDKAGNSYICGDIREFGWFIIDDPPVYTAGYTDLFVAKYNTAGVFQWAKLAGGINFDHGRRISIDQYGNSYVLGRFDSTAAFGPSINLTSYGGNDGVIAKIDSSSSLSVQNISTSGFSISPNPTSGMFTVTSQEEITAIEIYNVLGETISSLSLGRGAGGEVEINLSAQSKGIYFIKVQCGDKVSTQKIVIQ